MKKNPVKLTVIRASKYDLYMKKFQPKGTCQCNAIDVRIIKPIRSGFSLLKTFKLFRSNIAGWLISMLVVLAPHQFCII